MLGFTSEATTLRPFHREQQLYFMLKPPHALAMEIDRQRRVLGLRDKYPLERFHITLQPFGDIRALSRKQLEQICFAAESLQTEPFTVSFSRMKSNALVSSNTRALRSFQRELVQLLISSDVPLPDYAFDPHLTLAYGEYQKRNDTILPASWIVDELLLINSVHGHGHTVVGSWTLTTKQGAFDL